MQKQNSWIFPQNKQYPFALVYDPNLIKLGEQFLNPFLGYPNCPLIGRYNGGQYRIAQTKAHIQFQCKYDQKQNVYKCGQKIIRLPEKMLYNLRNIPQVIKHNKPQNQAKNSKIQDTHPLKYPVLNGLKFIFMITFGQIGKDFLNYLNHMYTLGHELFMQQKLRRSVYLLPIYAYLPQKSGIMEEEVDKGLNLENYRSQYMSLHLKYGAPAFSPNNMRLGIQGMKKVVSNPPGKKQNKYKQKPKGENQSNLNEFLKINQQKENQNNKKQNQIKINQSLHDQKNQQQILNLNWQEIENDIKQKQISKEGKLQEDLVGKVNQIKISKEQKVEGKTHMQNKNNKIQQKKAKQISNSPHKGYVHFYSSMLLEEDYRVYYHWHIQKQSRCQIIQTALLCSNSLQQFFEHCINSFGQKDQCVKQALNIFQGNY